MRGLVLAFALAVSGTQAVALSCQRVEPHDSFTNAAAAEEIFIVVHGRFAFEPAQLPQSNSAPPSASATIPAMFSGMGLTRDGFTTPLDFPVTLDAVCLGPWCGALAPDVPLLAFLERQGDGYHLEVGPCPGRSFANPVQATLDQMTKCLNGGCDAPN